ncbi:MAG: glycosyltransferase family 1 protein [Bacteroidia bacterium]|nr:glycosyltransferase family 1 protein [Bacteroidia bacterium]
MSLNLLKRTNKPTANRMIAKYTLTPAIGLAVRAYLARPYIRSDCRRVCIYYEPNRISFSQVYPFIYFKQEIEQRYNVEIRCVPVNVLFQGRSLNHLRADVILLQTWFTVDQRSLRQALTLLVKASPTAEISFLDSFAHNDIRLSQTLDPFIRFYIKKTLFRDQSKYLRAYHGDTNLTEYYGKLYGISYNLTNWGAPESVLDKLRVGPSFFTAPHFMSHLALEKLSTLESRNIDIHARIGVSGTGWYQAMRAASLERVLSLSNLKICTGLGLSWKKYMAELRNSKLCFSPFGYGELCWRDVEAFVAGAVLVKPDMSHLETLPDLYVDNETYLAIKWDFSDLSKVVTRVLSDDGLRKRLATEAYRRISDYVKTAKFVDDISFLFDATTEDPAVRNSS